MTTDFRKTKNNWIRPSVNRMNPAALKQQQSDPNYRPRAPWEQVSTELLDDFNRNLEAMAVDVKAPWEEGSLAFEIQERERQNAANYRYQSMFEVPEMSEERRRQLEEYQMNPPFNCGYNAVEEPLKSAKKLNPNKNPRTREPWAYGALPAQPVPRKIFERPATSLWEVPRGDQNQRPEMIASGDPILDSLRAQLHARGALGIQGLARKFKILDDDGSGTLNVDEFRKGMRECAICDLSDKALNHLFRYFDKDDSGTISYDEFLVGIRGVMNARRQGLVAMAFRVLDTDGSGIVDLDDIRLAYNAKAHPDVIVERKTEDEVLWDFLETFTAGRGRGGGRPATAAAVSAPVVKQPPQSNGAMSRPGTRTGGRVQPPQLSHQINSQPVQQPKPTSRVGITLKDFSDYYANISASIDSDDYFELMIRNAWHISGGQGQYANSTNRRVLVTHADGRQTVEEVQNDIGISAKDTDKMMQKLQQQGLTSIKNINLSGIEDMKHQIENPQYRARLVAEQNSQAQQEYQLYQQQQQQSQPQSQRPYSSTHLPATTSYNSNSGYQASIRTAPQMQSSNTRGGAVGGGSGGSAMGALAGYAANQAHQQYQQQPQQQQVSGPAPVPLARMVGRR